MSTSARAVDGGVPRRSGPAHSRLFNLVDRLVSRLLDSSLRRGKRVDLTELELGQVCEESVGLLLDEPACLSLQLDTSLVMVGDLHGHLTDLLHILDRFGPPPHRRYLFLGNFVSHGPHSVELLLLLLCYKLRHPSSVFLLRGNHENRYVPRAYKLYEEILARFSHRAWRSLVAVFEALPVAALVEKVVFASHSGISPELLRERLSGCRLAETISQSVVRPADGLDDGMACDLTWAEPDLTVTRWAMNESGASFLFGVEVLRELMEKFELLLVVRSNRFLTRGYEFFDDRRLLTIFSAADFVRESKNSAAVLELKRSENGGVQAIEARIVTFEKPPEVARSKKDKN